MKIRKAYLGILFLAVVLIASIAFSLKTKTLAYSMTNEEVLNEVLKREETFLPQKVLELVNRNDSSVIFIDLRTPHDFIKGHIKNAVNVPTNKLLNSEFKEIFNDSRVKILYHNNHVNACGPWMLLKQTGFAEIKILLGGYETYSKIEHNVSNDSLTVHDEKEKYDYSLTISKMSGSDTTAVSNKTQPTVTQPLKKKPKNKQVEGGC